MGFAMLSACTQDENLAAVDDSNIIHVGGVSTEDMMTTPVVTRATTPVAAETEGWLADMLKQGMDIKYLTESAQQKARLKLETDANGGVKKSEGGFTMYSLMAYDASNELTAVPAKWLGNGVHTFQGVYVPESLKVSSTTKSHEALSRYTAVPPMAEISATVGRITIPLQHRLARVVAYVLIEPGMGATLKGYDTLNIKNNENVENTKLRFCNVKTLDYVNAQGQPVWKEERKAIPHYLGEEEVTYEGKNYGKCPYYDLIVRPTYTVRTEGSNVMYDEATPTAAESNNIDFELTLSNDLEYEKSFTFDLNANDETVVYLRVTPERIDYNSAGSRLWKETNYGDDYYGVNNPGYSLSTAGSSWQRAYTNNTSDYPITDGMAYKDNQYVSDAEWITMFFQAYEGGDHHGDYFILDHDITISATDIPTDFVFTGHLDGMGHTITIEGGYLLSGLNGTYRTAQENNQDATWVANVHKEGNTWVPTAGWRAEVVNTIISGGRLLKADADVSGYVNNCQDQTGSVTYYPTTIPTY